MSANRFAATFKFKRGAEVGWIAINSTFVSQSLNIFHDSENCLISLGVSAKLIITNNPIIRMPPSDNSEIKKSMRNCIISCKVLSSESRVKHTMPSAGEPQTKESMAVN